MKFISKVNLMTILDSFKSESVSEGTIQNIMDWYGDSFEKDDTGNWIRLHENVEIQKLLGNKYEDVGNVINRKPNE